MKYENNSNPRRNKQSHKESEVGVQKYRLKKDLPFAKAGDEVEIINGEPIFFKDGFHCDYSSIDDLLADGWIEEIKPREFLLHFTDDTFSGIDEKMTPKSAHELWHNAMASNKTILVIQALE